jgi:hypothetical protein
MGVWYGTEYVCLITVSCPYRYGLFSTESYWNFFGPHVKIFLCDGGICLGVFSVLQFLPFVGM